MGSIINVLLKELGHKFKEIHLNCDNMGAISLVNNLSFYLKIKHIDICIHMIHGYVEYGYVSLSYI